MGDDTTTTRSGVVETPTARLAYDERGSGEAVVFVHSGITDCQMWDPQFSVLSGFVERYRTVRYDFQGFGDSTATGPGTNREELRALLDGLGVDRAHLVGASFGGGVALDAALCHPERVRSLTLVGPAVGGHDYDDDSPTWGRVEALYGRSIEAFEAGDLERAAELEVELWVVGPEREVEAVDAGLREQVYRMDLAALRNEAVGRRPDETDLDPPAIERLGELEVPTLVVVGEYDLPHVHDATRRLEQEVPDAHRVVVEDAAHLPSLERPMAFTDAVVGFLDDR